MRLDAPDAHFVVADAWVSGLLLKPGSTLAGDVVSAKADGRITQ